MRNPTSNAKHIMHQIQFVAMFLLTILFSGTAKAEFEGHPLLVVINATCLVQDAGNRNGRFWKAMQKRPDFPAWETIEQSPLGKCVKGRKFVSGTLCKASLDVELEDEDATNKCLAANSDEIRKIRPFIEFAFS